MPAGGGILFQNAHKCSRHAQNVTAKNLNSSFLQYVLDFVSVLVNFFQMRVQNFKFRVKLNAVLAQAMFTKQPILVHLALRYHVSRS